MFTIKLFESTQSDPVNFYKERILEAESFTIVYDESGQAEVTLHDSRNYGERYDIHPPHPQGSDHSGPKCYQKAIIENSHGKTTKVVTAANNPR